MGTVVGIDLGTTNSAIAHIDEFGQPRVIPNDAGKSVIPSVICFQDDGEVLVGEYAKEYQSLQRYPVASLFKPHIGERHWVFNAHGQRYTATDLSAIVLRELKRSAEAHLGHAVEDAVITVPAYFRDPERRATERAGEAAGFNVLRLINEPTAAAVAYGFKHSKARQRLLVYDLGGGTFDVTILEAAADGIDVLVSDGDHHLGGQDWDKRLVRHLASLFEEQFDVDPLAGAGSASDLMIRAEEAKCRLSDVRHTVVQLVHGGRAAQLEIDRDTFESLTADLMEGTKLLTLKALEEAGLDSADLDGVLLVGGSTRMPMVDAFVEEHFGQPPLTGVNVDEVVALGAAVVASNAASSDTPAARGFSLPGVTIRDATNHSLGLIAITKKGDAYTNVPLLPRNARIPCEETRPFRYKTSRHGPNDLEVFVTQGESTEPADVTYLDLRVLKNIPPRSRGTTVIDITYSYDESTKVQVQGRVRGTGEVLAVAEQDLPDDVPARFLQPPELTRRPRHFTAYLAIDVSGSMRGDRLTKAKQSAISFLENVDLAHCSVGLIAFSDNAATKLEAAQNANEFEAAVQELACGETGGGTSGQPFDEAQPRLAGPGPAFLVVLTDGEWFGRSYALRRARECHKAGIEVIAIGIGEADEAFLAQIASSDQGSFFSSLDGLEETFSTIAQVVTEGAGGLSMRRGKGTSGRGGGLRFLGDLLRKK